MTPGRSRAGLKPWAEHIASGGAAYNCNKRPDKPDDDAATLSAQSALEYFQFYFLKVVGQRADKRHAEASLKDVDERVSMMTAALGAQLPFGAFTFFKEALETVVASRTVAEHAYIHAFFVRCCNAHHSSTAP